MIEAREERPKGQTSFTMNASETIQNAKYLYESHSKVFPSTEKGVQLYKAFYTWSKEELPEDGEYSLQMITTIIENQERSDTISFEDAQKILKGAKMVMTEDPLIAITKPSDFNIIINRLQELHDEYDQEFVEEEEMFSWRGSDDIPEWEQKILVFEAEYGSSSRQKKNQNNDNAVIMKRLRKKMRMLKSMKKALKSIFNHISEHPHAVTKEDLINCLREYTEIARVIETRDSHLLTSKGEQSPKDVYQNIREAICAKV